MTAIDPSRLMAMRAQILERNDALQRAAGLGFDNPVGGAGAAGRPDPTGFADAMRGALSQVNDMQAQSGAISEAYERGETTDIAAVMLARQQASVGFEATMQVRNRLLSAYKDIMNMPV
jgi:flagellar hook-basal body complex protein FliE